jgi:thiol-disulfide isomerase/thioredoxin
MTRAILAVLALSTVLGCDGGKSGKDPAAHPMARKPAPDVEVKLANGSAFHPRDAAGKVLVLDFWATWCQPCKASFPKVDAIYKKHASKGLEVVAINEDDEQDKVPPFLAEVKPTFTIAFDNKGKAAEAYGVETMPSSFIIDRRGVVRYAHSGYHPDDSATIEAEIEGLLAESP